MICHYYRYAGLVVSSEIPVPEWASFEISAYSGDVDVAICLGEVLDGDFSGTRIQRIVSATDCRFLVPGVSAFRIFGGRQIVVAPAADIPLHRLRPWLLSSAWAALCYQRRRFLVHASAVMVGGEAVLFCARTKGGKSTLAAHLSTCGYPVISDDLCHIEMGDGVPPSIHPSATRLKLWGDTLNHLGWAAGELEQDHARPGKFYIKSTNNFSAHVIPIGGIYLLEWGSPGLRRLQGLSGLERFLSAASYRGKLLESAGLLSWYSSCALRVLQTVPVWELRRTRDLGALRSGMALLADHWSASHIIAE